MLDLTFDIRFDHREMRLNVLSVEAQLKTVLDTASQLSLPCEVWSLEPFCSSLRLNGIRERPATAVLSSWSTRSGLMLASPVNHGGTPNEIQSEATLLYFVVVTTTKYCKGP